MDLVEAPARSIGFAADLDITIKPVLKASGCVIKTPYTKELLLFLLLLLFLWRWEVFAFEQLISRTAALQQVCVRTVS